MANYGKHENVVIIKGLSGASKWNFRRVYFMSRLTGGDHNNRARFARVRVSTQCLYLAIDKVLYLHDLHELNENQINSGKSPQVKML